MTLRGLLFRLAIVSGPFLGMAGCGGSPEGDLPTPKPITKEESDTIAKSVQEGMKSGYKGAPGVPLKNR
jgi:hypothetical protein